MNDKMVFTCTQENPWSEEKSVYAMHPDAKCYDYVFMAEYDLALYECPHCGKKFQVEE